MNEEDMLQFGKTIVTIFCQHENITYHELAFECDDCEEAFSVYEISDMWAEMKKGLRK